MELNNIVYFLRTIDDPSPLERLARLFQQYQALSYGVSAPRRCSERSMRSNP